MPRVSNCKMNPPAKAGVVLRGDRPWDMGWISGAGTVIEDGGRYRMWYTGLPPVKRFEDDRFRLCYAESKDGVHWEKPNLGIYEWRGSRANNILMETNIENAGGVFVDPTAPAAARYKLVAILNRTASPPDGNGLYVYQSADGAALDAPSEASLPVHPRHRQHGVLRPTIEKIRRVPAGLGPASQGRPGRD